MGNLSQQKRQRMLAFLEKIKTEHQDDDETLQVLSEIENELNSKKYGLVWEKHEEQVDVMMQDNIPVFTEVEEREIKATDENAYNFLLEGDNLHSLKLLEKSHAGMIDLIYIDPPYNRGKNDFIYDDAFIDKTDGYAHSKWLSFMNARLEVAKRLLADEGVIFISIDDNEQAQLKMLCDAVLGEENFIAESIVASNSSKNNSNHIAVNHEYLLCYTKNIAEVKKGWQVKKNQIDEFEKRARMLLNMNLPAEEMHNELLQLVKYPRFYDFDHYTYVDSQGVYRTDNPGGVKNGNLNTEIIHPVTGKPCVKPSGGWRYSESTLHELLEKDAIHFGKDETIIPTPKRYLHDYPMQVPKSTLFFDSQATTKWLKKEKIAFDFPKAIEYIKHILSYTQDQSATILDFFAGSGTTAHAVLELNKEDGGNRKFILCTNNESNICEEVTYERIKRVIDGYGDVEGIPANLKYFKTDFIPKRAENVSDQLLAHIKEMVELENGITLDNKHYLIVLTDEEADALAKSWSSYKDVKAIYVSRNVLFTSEQNELFSNTEIHIIPDYYFEYELKEVGETW